MIKIKYKKVRKNMKNIFDKATTKKYEVEGFILNKKNINKFCDVR